VVDVGSEQVKTNTKSRNAGDGATPHHRVRTAHERTVLASRRSGQERFADAVTRAAGSMGFVYLHVLWFGAWICLNEGLFGTRAFDPFPYGLLTMIVSLEAIFLSTFVMISQNREARRQNVRAELDFETNVRSEVWSMHMGRALGLDPVEIEKHVQAAIAQSRDSQSALSPDSL
jgi:uncharacterized membrane protein